MVENWQPDNIKNLTYNWDKFWFQCWYLLCVGLLIMWYLFGGGLTSKYHYNSGHLSWATLHTKHWVPEIRQKPVRMTKFWRVQIIKWTTLGRHFDGNEIDNPFSLSELTTLTTFRVTTIKMSMLTTFLTTFRQPFVLCVGYNSGCVCFFILENSEKSHLLFIIRFRI